jgi:hypothetical protein
MKNRNPKMALVMPTTMNPKRLTPYQALRKAAQTLLTDDGLKQLEELAQHFENPNTNTGARA